MKKFLVCDGGGTKTDFLVFNEEAEVLGYCQKSGANANFISKITAINNVLEGISECILKANLSIKEIESITLFIPGFDECKEELKSRLKVNNITCFGDIDNAFYGALGTSKGIVALSGTGSFAVGISSNDEKISTGGWGPLIGDRGSGYHIGILLLEKIVDFYDRDIKLGYLRDLCFSELGVNNEIEMRDEIYKQDFTREKVASLCKVVAKAASNNDKYALEILREAAKELVRLVAYVNERLGKDQLKVSLIGGVSKIGKGFIDIFKEELEYQCSNLTYSQPMYDPLIGAMLCVLKNELNINIESNVIKNNLKKYKGGYIKC